MSNVSSFNHRYAESVFDHQLHDYIALEIDGVCNPGELEDPNGTNAEINNKNPEFFSVFAQHKDGGKDCIGDFGNHELAKQYAKEIAKKYYLHPIYDFLKATAKTPINTTASKINVSTEQ